jgi:hypothetical protein
MLSYPNSTECLLLSPRSIAFNHGTGAQLSYLLDTYDHISAINYGFYEKGRGDRACFFDSVWHRFWPWKMRGRGVLASLNDRLPFSIWRDHQLTDLGRKVLRKKVVGLGNESHCVAVVHDTVCAKRVNAIMDVLGLPYDLILYDLMHLDTVSKQNFPELSRCISNSESVYAISRPLRDAARLLGAKDIRAISFYRPKSTQPRRTENRDKESRGLKILVVADAKPHAFKELLTSVAVLRSESPTTDISIHFVGNASSLPLLVQKDKVDVTFHGFVSAQRRDEIASGCDLAFLAGSTSSAKECPLVKYSIPSKLGDFSVFGLPVLARVSSDSAAAEFIREEISGFVRMATNQEEVLTILRELCANRDLIFGMVESALAFADARLFLPNATTNALVRKGRQVASPQQ